MVICLEQGADLHTAQLIPLPLTVSCFSKIQIGFTFLVPAHPGSPGKRAVKRVSVCLSPGGANVNSRRIRGSFVSRGAGHDASRRHVNRFGRFCRAQTYEPRCVTTSVTIARIASSARRADDAG